MTENEKTYVTLFDGTIAEQDSHGELTGWTWSKAGTLKCGCRDELNLHTGEERFKPCQTHFG